MNTFKILVACEESQEVSKRFRMKGCEAYSCDIIDCSGGHPEFHIKQDVLELLKGNCHFRTCDEKLHYIDKWDLIVAFPPCTDLCVSGARHFEKKRLNGKQKDSIEFFCQFLKADCDRVAIENPVNIISGHYIEEHFPELCEKYSIPIKPTQIIQPFEFGHPYTKHTCLWLKGLSELKPTNILKRPENGWVNQSFTHDGRYGGFKNFNGSKQRSKTFPGIAEAMVNTWFEDLIKEGD